MIHESPHSFDLQGRCGLLLGCPPPHWGDVEGLGQCLWCGEGTGGRRRSAAGGALCQRDGKRSRLLGCLDLGAPFAGQTAKVLGMWLGRFFLLPKGFCSVLLFDPQAFISRGA